jgi:RyR domain
VAAQGTKASLPLGGQVVVGTYKPQTIDTSQVQLRTDLQELIERLAENNHDHWARKRIEKGWHYGPNRNDSEKEHPDLVPYAELSESEKSYDRKTVIEVLKAIVAIGYDIRRI